MAADPVMVPVFVVGLPQLPASILALPDMDATVMLPDTSPTVMLACPLISASTLRLRTLHPTSIFAPSVIVGQRHRNVGGRRTLTMWCWSYVRTSAALGNFQARVNHDESPRTPPLVDASSPQSPYVAEASGAHRAGAPRATGTGPHPKESRLVGPRVALGRLSRRRRWRTWGRRGRRKRTRCALLHSRSHRESSPAAITPLKHAS